VTLSGKDEIAKLAGNINRMLDNLDRADEAIRLDEERYRAFVSQSAEAIWCFDFRQPVPTHLPAEEQIDWAYNNGYLTECNDAMARMYGFQSSDQILGAKIGDILPKEDPKNLQFLYAILENDYSIANIETHDIDKDGNFFYTLNNLTGIIEDGKLVRIWGTQRDITNLKKNEENLRFLAHTISSVNDAVTITDLEGKLIFVNDAFCKTYGYTPQEVIGKGVDFLRAENQVPKEEIRQTTIEGGWSGELLNRRANGEIFPIYLSTSKVINEKGEIIGLVGISRDITEEKITLEALITSEMRYRNLFENATDAIFLLRGDKILDCNKSAERMFRCTHKELLDQHPLTFSPPIQPDGSDSNEKSLEKYKSALEGNPQNFEWMHRRFDGGSFYTEVNLSRIQLGGEWILLSIIRDFSERRRMEEALKASEEFNRGIIVNAPVGIIYLDATGIIVYENPEMMKMMGMPEGVPSAVTGKNILHIPNIVKAGGDSMIRRLLKGELIKGETIEYESLYGVKKTLEIHASPLKDSEGNIFGAVLMCVDITSYKQLEAQLRHSQKIEAIGTLAEGIAHDFNNLLTGIIGNTEFALISLGESHPVRRHLEQVQDISKRAAELTSRLLSFGRRKAEKLLPVNLNDAINETVNLIQRTIDPKISLITQKHPDLWITFADSGQIHQVLMNLLVNARDALPSGGTITIKSSNEIITTNYCLSHKLARPGEYIRLDICDDGLGISPEDLPRIFEPFFTTKEAGKGTGLGLAMVMDIIVNHKGWIEVESEPNKGTTFSVFLPRLQDTIREEKTSPEAQFQGGSETILLVDDEESVRALGKKTLERFGYTVLLASDGKEAIEIYQKKQSEIDLIIIDLLMPRISGKDTLLELQSLNKEVKVILCSGYAVGETVQEFLNMGAKGFVHKPFAFKQLLGAIREALD
jgi:PAS domain S-box-containing protein